MDASSWKRKVNTATDAGAVVRVIQDFIHSLDTVELETLPPEVRPTRIDTPSDISRWAFNLAAASLAKGSTTDHGILGGMSLVFAEASRRLGQVTLRREDAEADDNPLREEDAWVLVFDYEYWDPQRERMIRAEWSAPLDAIRNGLGQAIIDSGRKVKFGQLDAHGRVPAARKRDTAGG